MATHVSPEDAHHWFGEHMKRRVDIGVGNAILGVLCCPRSPFNSKERRRPRKEFLLAAGVFVAGAAWFVYFSILL